jgi:hypothetical protein
MIGDVEFVELLGFVEFIELRAKWAKLFRAK